MTIANRHRSSRQIGRPARILTSAAALGIGAVVAGCGAAPDPSGRSEDREPTARAASALGESTCASASQDVIITQTDGTATSPDGNYDHPDCRNAFIAIGYATAQHFDGHWASAYYAGPMTTPQYLGCNAMWIQMSLYKWNGGQYVKVGDDGPYYGYEDSQGNCQMYIASVETTGNGVYKIAAAAGIISSTVPVKVQFEDFQVCLPGSPPPC